MSIPTEKSDYDKKNKNTNSPYANIILIVWKLMIPFVSFYYKFFSNNDLHIGFYKQDCTCIATQIIQFKPEFEKYEHFYKLLIIKFVFFLSSRYYYFWYFIIRLLYFNIYFKLVDPPSVARKKIYHWNLSCTVCAS